jgi:peptidase E
LDDFVEKTTLMLIELQRFFYVTSGETFFLVNNIQKRKTVKSINKGEWSILLNETLRLLLI